MSGRKLPDLPPKSQASTNASALADVRDVLRGAIASFFGFGGRLIARVMLMVLAGRAFGIEALGHLGQIAAICEILAALSILGLKRSLLDMLSFDAAHNRAPERRIVEAACLVFAISAALSGAMLFVWPVLFPDLIAAHPSLLAALFAVIPGYALADTLLSAIKFKRVIKWDVWARAIIEPWGFLGLAVLALLLGLTDSGLIYAYAGSVVLAAATALTGLVRVYGGKTLAASQPKLSSWPAIIRQCAPVGITDAGIMMLRRLDMVVLSLFVGSAGAGLYYMVQQLATVPQKVNGLFEPMMSPVMARLHNALDGGRIRTHLVGVCRWVFIIQLALTIPMIVFGDKLLGLFGSAFAAGALTLALVLIAELINGTFVLVETPLVYAKPKIPPTLLVLTLAVMAASIALFASQWGVVGAGLGFLTAVSFLAMGRLYFLRKHLGIRILNTDYLIPIVIGALCAGLLYAARQAYNPQHPALITLYIAAMLGLYTVLTRKLAMTKADKRLFKALKRGRSGPK